MKVKIIAGITGAVIIIIFAYILKTIDENPSELSIEVTPFNIDHKVMEEHCRHLEMICLKSGFMKTK